MSLSITALLNYFNFQSTYQSARKSKFNVVGEDTMRAIEFGLSLGVPLKSLKNSEELFQRVRTTFPEVSGLFIIDTNGVPFFDNSINDSLESMTIQWVRSEVVQGNHTGLKYDLHNSFNSTVGYLVLWYTPKGKYDPVRAMGLSMILYQLGIVVTCSLILFVGVPIIFAHLSRQLKWMQYSLNVDSAKEKFIDDDVIAFRDVTTHALSEIEQLEKESEAEDE